MPAYKQLPDEPEAVVRDFWELEPGVLYYDGDGELGLRVPEPYNSSSTMWAVLRPDGRLAAYDDGPRYAPFHRAESGTKLVIEND